MNALYKLFLISVLSLLLTACGKPQDFDVPVQNSNTEDPGEERQADPIEEKPRQNFVCYEGVDQTNNLCYETETITSSSIANDYKYKNPENRVRNPHQYLQPLRFLNLDSLDLRSRVSSHFQIGEFLVRFKGQYGILSPLLINKLQEIRQNLNAPIVVNSGYRSPKYNSSVGGATFSRHMYGDASDMYSPQKSLDELKTQCQAHGASFIQLYRSHIHCDWRNHPLNVAFYPPSIGPKIDADPYFIFESQSFIGLYKGKQSTDVFINHPSAEDEADLRYEWTIHLSDGTTQEHITFSPQLQLNQLLNVERVTVRIGGTAVVSKIIK